MTRRRLLTGVASAAACGSRVSADEAGPVLYTRMTVIDGSGAAPRPDMALIVDGERIAMVFPAKQLEIMKLARMKVVDAAGLTVLPGPTFDLDAARDPRLKPAEAVQAAIGGRCIRAGGVADLAFVRGDPLTDLSALEKVAFTVKRGVLFAGS